MEISAVSVVSIAKCRKDDVEAAVRSAVSQTRGFETLPWEKATVLIKPNTVKPAPSGSGLITDARVVAAVVKQVLAQNPRKVIIGEGASVGYDFPGRRDSFHCMKVAGVLRVAEKFGLEVVDLNRDEQVVIKLSEALAMDTFRIAKTARDADIIVSVPVLKTHVRTGITCGLKNMKGAMPGDEKKRTHQCGLDRGVVDLNRVVKPHFTVVDGIIGLQGTHTEETDRVNLGLIIAGSDVVAVDAVSAAIAGFDPNEILHVQLAAEAGLGTADLNRIEIRGETIEEIRHPFVPYVDAIDHLFGGAKLIEKDTCTGCMGELVSTLIYLKQAGFEDRLPDLTLVIGTPAAVEPLDGMPVVVGRCAEAFKDKGVFVPGCPPHGKKITDAACEVLGIDKNQVRKAIDKLHDF